MEYNQAANKVYEKDMQEKQILIVEDDANLARLLKNKLEEVVYRTVVCKDGLSAIETALHNRFLLIIIDILIPEIDGLRVLKTLRDNNIQTPVIVITGSLEKENEILAYKNGANIFHSKPINLELLLTQVKRVLSETALNSKTTLTVGNILIDPSRRSISNLAEEKRIEINLTNKEIKALIAIVEARGDIVTREKLLHLTNLYNRDLNLNSIDTLICRIRVKLKRIEAEEFIQTVHGSGYRFVIG